MGISVLAIVLVLSCVLFNLALGQQIDSVKVNDSIHMLTGKGGNSYIAQLCACCRALNTNDNSVPVEKLISCAFLIV